MDGDLGGNRAGQASTERSLHLLVTGATGYIGRVLVDLALRDGHKVTVLAREPQTPRAGMRSYSWSLGQDVPDIAWCKDKDFPAVDSVIHLAHDWTNRMGEGATQGGLNFESTQNLAATAQRLGVRRFVFVSSVSAREDAQNVYGRVKWQIEQSLQIPGQVSARVGLVYGGALRAQYALMHKISSLSPILPMVSPGALVQPIHVNEVSKGLIALAGNNIDGWRGLAGGVPITFGDALRTIARESFGQRLRILPIPLSVALLACDVTRVLPFLPTVDRERVTGLAGTRPLACTEHLQDMGLEVVSLAEGLRGEPHARRALLREAKTLLTYVLRKRPSDLMLRCYHRALRGGGRTGELVLLPSVVHRWPGMLRVMEPLGGQSALGDRLAWAMNLADTAPLWHEEARVRGLSRTGLILDLIIDGLCLPLRALARVWWI